MTIIDRDEDAAVCAGCDEPGSIEIVTIAPPLPVVGGLMVLFGWVHVAAWHGVCWVDAGPTSIREVRLPVPFTGTWEELDAIAPDGMEMRRRLWGVVKDAVILVALVTVAVVVAGRCLA